MSRAWAWACYRFVLAFPIAWTACPPIPWWHPARAYWAALPWAGMHAYRNEGGDR